LSSPSCYSKLELLKVLLLSETNDDLFSVNGNLWVLNFAALMLGTFTKSVAVLLNLLLIETLAFSKTSSSTVGLF
jgi:hypothetical protein